MTIGLYWKSACCIFYAKVAQFGTLYLRKWYCTMHPAILVLILWFDIIWSSDFRKIYKNVICISSGCFYVYQLMIHFMILAKKQKNKNTKTYFYDTTNILYVYFMNIWILQIIIYTPHTHTHTISFFFFYEPASYLFTKNARFRSCIKATTHSRSTPSHLFHP